MWENIFFFLWINVKWSLKSCWITTCSLLQTLCCESKVILCCYQAVNVFYYKYTVQGVNIFALSILLAGSWVIRHEFPPHHDFAVLLVCQRVLWSFQSLSIFFLLKPFSPADLLPLVFISLIFGYTDHEQKYLSSETKFATAITSIIPLSYYIGMGIAR